MTRDDQLKLCRICNNKKFDPEQGIICVLTGTIADFEISCDSYIENEELKSVNELKLKEIEILKKTASQGIRFVNFFLDLIFLLIFSYIFGFILGIVIAIVSPETLSLFEEDNKLINYLLGFISGMIYYSTFEIFTGRTLAKYITKTKVIDDKGEKPGFDTIIIRSLCRFIPFDSFSFLGSDNSGWHDKLSKTRVIKI